jgi:hypothetical protein
VLPSGEHCDSRRRLELDHITPLALGGKSTVENLRVACRSHNDLAAVQAGTWVTFCTGHMGDTLVVKTEALTREWLPSVSSLLP